MKILIVEDDHYYAQCLSDVLSDRGIECEVAASVQAALKINLRALNGAIIDVGLPNNPAESGISSEATRGGFMSGVALYRELRKRKRRMPCVFLSSDVVGGEAAEWAGQNNIPFVFKHDGQAALIRALEKIGVHDKRRTPQAFIVHGHDERTLKEMQRFIRKTLRWQSPIVLRELPSRGRTIIEKFEEHAARVDCVFVLLTPDDGRIGPKSNDQKRRARQNVVFELGFFYAQFGRISGRVFALRKGPLELPSDIQGIVWIDISKGISAVSKQIQKEVAHLVGG